MTLFYSEPKISQQRDIPELKALWKAAFGDTDAEINDFFQTAYNPENALVIYSADGVAAMLFLLDITLSSSGTLKNACYVYAVATAVSARGKGLMHRLLDFACDTALSRKKDALALIPANSELFGLYESCGFKKTFPYKTETADLNAYCGLDGEKSEEADYSFYLSAVRNMNKPVAICGEMWFNYLTASHKAGDGCIFLTDPSAYCFYDRDDILIVRESAGDIERLKKALASAEPGYSTAKFRLPDSTPGAEFLGMIKHLGRGSAEQEPPYYFGCEFA